MIVIQTEKILRGSGLDHGTPATEEPSGLRPRRIDVRRNCRIRLVDAIAYETESGECLSCHQRTKCHNYFKSEKAHETGTIV